MKASAATVHVYLLRDADPRFDALDERWSSVLSDEELLRATRFRLASHGRQSRLAHALKRHALSWHVSGVAPEDWRFVTGEHGKPQVEGMADAPAFNLSHSQGVIALAVGPTGGRHLRLGIDVEAMNRAVSEGVAERFFAPDEVADLLALSEPERPARFFALWTLKESYIKAVGAGLAIPLDSFAFAFSGADGLTFRVEGEDGARLWRFRQTVLDGPGGGHSLALGFAETPGERRVDVEVHEIAPEGRSLCRDLPWQRETLLAGR